MIRYALTCEQGHQFESWFKNSAAFETQVEAGLLLCPSCNSPRVAKAIMAPSVATRHQSPPAEAPNLDPPAAAPASPLAILSEREHEVRAKLKELREHLIRNADYVGQEFPDAARKMHYGEIDRRSIYGEASPDQAAALAEEGIEFHPLPYLPDERN